MKMKRRGRRGEMKVRKMEEGEAGKKRVTGFSAVLPSTDMLYPYMMGLF